MKPLLPLLLMAVLPLGACATDSRPYNPVRDVRYSAIGADPFWQLTIGDDRIVLRVAADPATGQAPPDAIWPRTLPRIQDGVTSWQSDSGTGAITVEARPGPCGRDGGPAWRDRVTVRLSGRELTGCGGPLVPRARD